MIFPSREFDAALSAMCDGTADAGVIGEVAHLLHNDPAARDVYLFTVELHARLASETQLFASQPAAAGPSQQQRSFTVVEPSSSLNNHSGHAAFRRWVAPLGALAATVLICVGLWWLMSRGEIPGIVLVSPPRPAASDGVLVRVLDVQSDTPSKWQRGQVASVDGMDIDSGSIRFRVEGTGVELSVAAPASLEMADSMHMRLRRGQVTTDALAAQKGFAVETDCARVVDMGTRFGVVASADGDTDVVVFEGEVELYERNGARTKKLANLNEGEAMQLGGRRKARAVWNVLSDGLENNWAISAPDALSAGLVARDNAQGKGPGHFYHILRHGLSPIGGKAFANANVRDKANRARWAPAEGGLPQWLFGADLVRTRQLKQYRPDFQLTLTLDHPASVFVLRDDGTPAPTWLSEEFTDTGVTVLLGPMGPPGIDPPISKQHHSGRYVACRVWRHDVVEPGDLVLGPPVEGGGTDALMYGIAVQSSIAR